MPKGYKSTVMVNQSRVAAMPNQQKHPVYSSTPGNFVGLDEGTYLAVAMPSTCGEHWCWRYAPIKCKTPSSGLAALFSDKKKKRRALASAPLQISWFLHNFVLFQWYRPFNFRRSLSWVCWRFRWVGSKLQCLKLGIITLKGDSPQP